MPLDPVIDLVQRRSDEDAGTPPDFSGHAPIPPWVSAAAEQVIVNEGDVTIRVGEEFTGELNNPVTDTTNPDALAYYLPFHFYRNTWGIYIRAAGVYALARRLDSTSSTIDSTALDFAYRLLLEHERFHFFTEYAASRLEIVKDAMLYKEYFGCKKAASHEEALANAHAILSLRRRSAGGLVEAAQAWMHTQPEGYRDFQQWLPPHFDAGRRHAALSFDVGPAGLFALVHGSYPAEFLFFRISRRPCPIRTVVDSSLPWLRVSKSFPKQFGLQIHVRTNDHKPPHIHIDRPPGTPYTRYLWPDLKPYPADPRLRSSEEKALARYVDAYRSAIASKVAAVEWQ